MYDYGLFQFNAPAYAGGEWFRSACKIVGLKEKHTPIMGGFFSVGCKLPVSSVMHPCDWTRLRFHHGPFGMTFDSFVRQYLDGHLGSISRTFDQYQADTVLRVEDQPWAFLELMEMLGVPEAMRKRLEDHPISPTFTPPIEWDSTLRRQFMESERNLCECYDYF